MDQVFEEKVKDFSDRLLRTQLQVYQGMVGESSPDNLKKRLEILQAEANKRWGNKK